MGVSGCVDDIVFLAGYRIVLDYSKHAHTVQQDKALFVIRCPDGVKCAVVIFVLWSANAGRGNDSRCVAADNQYLDDAGVFANQSRGVCPGVAVHYMADVGDVFKWYDFVSELNKSPLCRGLVCLKL